MNPKCLAYLLLALLLAGCQSKVNYVSHRFLWQLQNLNFTHINKLATGDALLQVALIQGRLDGDEEATLNWKRQTFSIQNDTTIALTNVIKVPFTVTTSDGHHEENSLILQNVKNWLPFKQWQVVSIEKSLVPSVKLFTNE